MNEVIYTSQTHNARIAVVKYQFLLTYICEQEAEPTPDPDDEGGVVLPLIGSLGKGLVASHFYVTWSIFSNESLKS